MLLYRQDRRTGNAAPAAAAMLSRVSCCASTGQPLSWHKQPLSRHKQPLSRHKQPLRRHEQPLSRHKQPLSTHLRPEHADAAADHAQHPLRVSGRVSNRQHCAAVRANNDPTVI